MEKGLESYLRFLKGEKSEFKILIQLYWDNMLLFTNSYIHNLSDAEDIAQEALIKLSVKRPKFVHENQLKAYLFKICRNLSINYLKKQNRHPQTELTEYLEEDILKIEERMDLKDSAQILHHTMLKLKQEYREILYLRYFEQLTISECAQVMKCTEKQATAMSYQARQALRNLLEKEGYTVENL